MRFTVPLLVVENDKGGAEQSYANIVNFNKEHPFAASLQDYMEFVPTTKDIFSSFIFDKLPSAIQDVSNNERQQSWETITCQLGFSVEEASQVIKQYISEDIERCKTENEKASIREDAIRHGLVSCIFGPNSIEVSIYVV